MESGLSLCGEDICLADSSRAFAGDVIGHLMAYPDGNGEVIP
jgi:hypothetical protein